MCLSHRSSVRRYDVGIACFFAQPLQSGESTVNAVSQCRIFYLASAPYLRKSVVILELQLIAMLDHDVNLFLTFVWVTESTLSRTRNNERCAGQDTSSTSKTTDGLHVSPAGDRTEGNDCRAEQPGDAMKRLTLSPERHTIWHRVARDMQIWKLTLSPTTGHNSRMVMMMMNIKLNFPICSAFFFTWSNIISSLLRHNVSHYWLPWTLQKIPRSCGAILKVVQPEGGCAIEEHQRALIALYKVQRAHQLLEEWVSDKDFFKTYSFVH